MRTIVLFVVIGMTILSSGCSKSGDAGLGQAAPVVDGLACSSCPDMVDCTSYTNPASRPISVDPRWQERLDLCCAFSLCEVDGACRYACPGELVDSRCR